MIDLLANMYIDRRNTIYYKLSGKDLDNRLVLLDTDNKILNMFEICKESEQVDIYVIEAEVVDSPTRMLDYRDYAPPAPTDWTDAGVPPSEEVHHNDTSEDENYNPIDIEEDSDDEEDDIDLVEEEEAVAMEDEDNSDDDNYLVYNKENPKLEVGMKFSCP